jgi:predicted nucleotidyltransferase
MNNIKHYVKTKIKPFGKPILLVKAGSQLHGTANENSDTDYLGVFIADTKYYLGLSKVEEVDISIHDKLENGKNSNEAIDIKLYELRKFITLSIQNNPNIVELLFVESNPDVIEILEPEMQRFLAIKKEFINAQLNNRFVGYATSQRKKMMIKAENFKELLAFKDTLEKFISKGESDKMLLAELQHKEAFKPFNNAFKADTLSLNNISLKKSIHLKKAINIINEKIRSSSHRRKEWLEKGFDIKMGYHFLRLMDEGIELLQTRELKFPLKNAADYKVFRSGKFTIEEALKMIEDKAEEFRHIEQSIQLPQKANQVLIENILIEVLEKHLLESFASRSLTQSK